MKKRDRKTKRNKKYGQAKLKPSKRGVFSCVLAALTVILGTIAVSMAYRKEGYAPGVIGGLGAIAFVFTGFGLYLAIRGFRERNRNHTICIVGTACHGLFVLLMLIIFCLGLFVK